MLSAERGVSQDSYTGKRETPQELIDWMRRREILRMLDKIKGDDLYELEKHVRGIIAATDEEKDPKKAGRFEPLDLKLTVRERAKCQDNQHG